MKKITIEMVADDQVTMVEIEAWLTDAVRRSWPSNANPEIRSICREEER